jgi:hypothetical protein
VANYVITNPNTTSWRSGRAADQPRAARIERREPPQYGRPRTEPDGGHTSLPSDPGGAVECHQSVLRALHGCADSGAGTVDRIQLPRQSERAHQHEHNLFYWRSAMSYITGAHSFQTGVIFGRVPNDDYTFTLDSPLEYRFKQRRPQPRDAQCHAVPRDHEPGRDHAVFVQESMDHPAG